MHRPYRFRRIFKWSGAGLSLVSFAATILSLWYTVYVSRGGVSGQVLSGVFSIEAMEFSTTDATISIEWQFDVLRVPFRMPELTWPKYWYAQVDPSNSVDALVPFTVRSIQLPAWLLLLLTAVPTAWLWHRDIWQWYCRWWRYPPGHCQRCGYDLTGNTSGVCSECGNKVRPPLLERRGLG